MARTGFLRSRTVQAALIAAFSAVVVALVPAALDWLNRFGADARSTDLRLVGMTPEGSGDPESPVGILAARAGVLGAWHDAYPGRIWEQLDPLRSYRERYDLISAPARILLPGVLAVVFQNAAGQAGPDIVIRSLQIRSTGQDEATWRPGEDVVVIYNYIHHFGSDAPSTRAKAYLRKGRSLHPVFIPEASFLSLNRQRLPPGEESLWVIELDTDARGEFVAELDVVVECHFVGRNSTEVTILEFEDVVRGATIRPSFGWISALYDADPGYEILLHAERPTIKSEMIWNSEGLDGIW